MHSVTISAKRDHEFEGENGGEYGGVWKEEMEKSNIVIIL